MTQVIRRDVGFQIFVPDSRIRIGEKNMKIVGSLTYQIRNVAIKYFGQAFHEAWPKLLCFQAELL